MSQPAKQFKRMSASEVDALTGILTSLRSLAVTPKNTNPGHITILINHLEPRPSSYPPPYRTLRPFVQQAHHSKQPASSGS